MQTQIQAPPKGWSRTEMAAMIAAEVTDGWCVNLGIGSPLEIANHFLPGREVVLHSENGVFGMGPIQDPPVDTWVVNAGKQNVHLRTGASITDHATSFAFIRGGHIDLCVLGAFEVAVNGDIANWTASHDLSSLPAVGGAMDLAVGAKNLWVMMQHTTKTGEPKLLNQCTLPLTATRAVDRVYTNLAVLDVFDGAFVVREMHPDVSLEQLVEWTQGPIVEGPVPEH
ncbi:3-oxoacid CoA-transferase subunit B [Ammonicoccus fulvus]|uniref:3-oxoacid CoA-transferase subunit B n=1 Tax=Ammonicoccus fulvus TaxID=3138240 RepID=A0ABZ3FMH5_9ACTN